jgi:hypothetical protein
MAVFSTCLVKGGEGTKGIDLEIGSHLAKIVTRTEAGCIG